MNNGPVQMFMLNPPESQPSEPSSSAQRLIDISRNTQVNLDNVSDFSNVCRTCATITELVIPIFAGEGLQNNIADKIHKHLPIEVSEADVLPRVVCYPCASALLAWHELVQCCVQADQAFRAKIAADTASNKDGRPTTQKPLEEDSQSKLKPVGNYVVQHMAPPRYPMTYRRCDFCQTKHPDTTYKDHLVIAHSERIFYCEECDEYIDKKDFLLHMSLHAMQFTSHHEMKDIKKVKKIKIKRKSDVNQNINVDVPETPKSKPASIAPTPNPVKSNEENEFSDHSDMEYGFGPLPESVFEAIEDSQDSQPTEGTRGTPGIDSQNDESNKSEPPTEDDDTKKLRKRVRTCPICSKVYQASSSYFYHMKYTHKQIKEHECQICAKKFATRTSLKIHAATHTGESQFECEQCKKRFRSNASLYIHEQTHIGVKSWSCNQCHRSFRWKTHLLRHMKRHSAEKAHVCTTCGRGFSIRCDLLRHARTHTAGQFDCDKCDVKFAQLRYLKVHMEKKHSAKVTKC